MQQTETYKLNLVEGEDTFSPLPLNENAEKLEGALGGLDAADAALDARVTVLEAKKIVFGHYAGTNQVKTITLGFTPLAVLFSDCDVSGHHTKLVLKEHPAYRTSASNIAVQIVEGGFCLKQADLVNDKYFTYNFIAFG